MHGKWETYERGGWSHYGGIKQVEGSGCHEIKVIKALQQQEGTLRGVNWATVAQGKGYRGEDLLWEDAEEPTDEGKVSGSGDGSLR